MPKAESDVVSLSQKLLMSEGSIYCSSPGSFILMPMAVRSLEKLVKLIDQEMKLIGAQKIIMPSLIPTSLLKKSGRFKSVASELFTLPYQDLLLAPTHEELVCQMVNRIPNLSRKSLPLYLYQITTKYRNEKRPRSGLLRTREFLMKDLYTFDVDHESAQQTYARVCQAYDRIFDRLRIPVCKVSADTGSIGGEFSHEYHVLSNAGQDKILICSKCGHAMSEELVRLQGSNGTKTKPIMSHESSSRKSSLPFSSSSSTSSAGLGIRELSGSEESGERDSVVRISSTEKEEIVRELMGAMAEGMGRKDEDIAVSADNMREHGSPEDQEHESGGEVVLKCANCSAGASTLVPRKGIEVGHTFLLGNKYTETFDVRFTDVNNQQVLSQMGCYGIGVTRLLAASLEALSPTNEQHMTWPQMIAPFDVVFVPPKSGSREEEAIGTEFMQDFAHKLASSTGMDVLIDDRTHLTIGRRRKDHWKAGVPFAVIAGKAAASSIPLFEVISYNTTASHSHQNRDELHQGQEHRTDHPTGDRDESNNITDPRHGSESLAGKSQGFHCEFLTYSQTMDYFSKPDFLSRWLTS
jgi:prolyl-tRNA synthetase